MAYYVYAAHPQVKKSYPVKKETNAEGKETLCLTTRVQLAEAHETEAQAQKFLAQLAKKNPEVQFEIRQDGSKPKKLPILNF